MKENYEEVELSEIVGEDMENEIKKLAEISMGTEIT